LGYVVVAALVNTFFIISLFHFKYTHNPKVVSLILVPLGIMFFFLACLKLLKKRKMIGRTLSMGAGLLVSVAALFCAYQFFKVGVVVGVDVMYFGGAFGFLGLFLKSAFMVFYLTHPEVKEQFK